jgi:hypothetical protein
MSKVSPAAKLHGSVRRTRTCGKSRPRWVSVALLTCLAVVVSLVGQPIDGVATAGATGVQADQPAANPGCDHPSPGQCNIDPANGCPTAGPVTAPAGQHCVPIPVELKILALPGSSGHGCNWFLQVQLLPTVSDYEAVMYSDIGLGTRWFSDGSTWPSRILGIGGYYDVPKGYAAWSTNYGACSSAGWIFGIDAWGVTDRWAVSGQITYAYTNKPAVGVSVTANCPSGYPTSTDDNGDYELLLQQGPCTIVPTPPDGLSVDPEKRVLDVEGNIDNVDFQIEATLYFEVDKGLSVTTKTTPGGSLIKAGTAFTERVILKDISKTKTVVVAPIYPAIQGNAVGGNLQPVGGTVQKQLSADSDADPSPVVVLRPGQEQEFDSVIATVASRQLGTDDGGQPVTGGTRAYVQFTVPKAFILHDDDTLTPLDPRQVIVAKGSTDKLTISIDDSAPDQTSFNGYLATWDISKGIVLGLWHVTYGLVTGLWEAVKLAGSAIVNIPTAVNNYIDLESQLWQEAKDNPAEMLLLTNAVTNSMLLIYKQAPFLLKKLGNLKGGIDAAVSKHFNTIEQDWYNGDWENAVTEFSDDSAEVAGNVGTLFINPFSMVGAVGNVTIARIPALLKGLEAADTARFAADAKVVDAALGSGESFDEVGEAEQALYKSYPGLEPTITSIAETFGINASMMYDLANFCRQNRVVITLRSRAFEAIDLIERGLSVVKPAAIKLKTVSQIDVDWLGFPSKVAVDSQEVPAIGQVMYREPIYLSETCAAECALGQLQDKMRAARIAEGSPEWVQISDRWAQRYDEYVNQGAGYIPNLQAAAKEGELTLPWHWEENAIDPALPRPPQTVGFKMGTGPDGVQIPLVCPEWSVATKVCSGTWKSVTGDVDLVSVTAADGSPLSDKRYVNVLQKLGGSSLDIQHPATATWYKELNDDTYSLLFDPKDKSFQEKAKYMMADKCCLLQVGADGVPREVMLNLKGSEFDTKNNYFLNYVGRELVPAP